MKNTKMLAFDVLGYMAHFRRFYTSVTSLSYHFPPRSTVAGLLAAILGLERDSYYDLFSRDKCGIALSILLPLRKLTLSLNHLDTDSVTISRLRGIGNRVPTTIELILPEPPHQRLGYRVFVSHSEAKIFEELRKRLRSGAYAYPPALGPAYCLADVNLVFDDEVEVFEADGDEFPVSTVIREDLIIDGGIVPKAGLKIMVEERLPPYFKADRKPVGRSANYFFEVSGKPIPVKIRGDVFRARLPDGEIYGVFM